MKSTNKYMFTSLRFLVAMLVSLFVVMFQGGGLYAISQSALDAINRKHPFYVPCSTGSPASSGSDTTTGAASEDMVKFLAAWAKGESGGGGGDYNPLNYVGGEGTNHNGVGVKNYASYEDGIKYSVKFLSQDNTKAIADGIKSGDVEKAIQGIDALYTWDPSFTTRLLRPIMKDIDVSSSIPNLKGHSLGEWANDIINALGGGSSGANNGGGAVKNVYILGDSITVRSAPSYTSSFESKGVTVNIDGSSSRSINGPGIDNNRLTGMQAIEQDAEQIKQAGAIVVALGTNGGNTPASVDAAIKAIRRSNSSAPIYWVDTIGVGGTNFKGSAIKQANDAIYGEKAKDSNFNVISWFKAVYPAGDPQNPDNNISDLNSYIDNSDGLGVHPTAAGQKALAELVVNAILNGGGSTATNGGNSEAGMCCGTSTGAASASEVNGADNEAKIWNYFVGKGIPAAGIAGIMGNMKAESGYNPSIEQVSTEGKSWGDMTDRYFIKGVVGAVGLVQWDGPRRPAVTRFLQAKGFSITDLRTPTDKLLGAELDFIWEELNTGYKSTLTMLQEATDPAQAAYKFHELYEGSNDSMSAIQEGRINPAIEIFNKYSTGGTPTTPTNGSSGNSGIPAPNECGGNGNGGGSSNGVVAGNIIQTAMGLAWPEYTKPKTEPTPAYADALEKYNPTRAGQGADCGTFVATVMLASGVDPDYPPVGTSAQAQHVTNSDKYTVFTPTSIDQLQPGDIMIRNIGSGTDGNGHTLIYTGPNEGFEGYTTIDASLGTRSGMASNGDSDMINKGSQGHTLIVARIK